MKALTVLAYAQISELAHDIVLAFGDGSSAFIGDRLRNCTGQRDVLMKHLWEAVSEIVADLDETFDPETIEPSDRTRLH
jgi:hypothetical protein